MKVKMLFLVLCIALANPAFGEELTQEKKDAIKELMEVAGAADIGEILGRAFAQQMIAVLQTANPDIPSRAFKVVEEEINDIMKEELLEKGTYYELICPVYHKYLTLSDIRAVIAFYKTPAGQKVIKVMPQITQESMMVGQSWGQRLGPIIQKRIKERFEKEGIDFTL